MKKKIIVFLLSFVTGATFAQTPADSIKIQGSPELWPRSKFKKQLDLSTFKREVPHLNKQKLIYRTPSTAKAKANLPEDVTPFYSNMPMATFKGKSEPMPFAKADSTVHYHLLKKRYKVMPIPSEEEGIIK